MKQSLSMTHPRIPRRGERVRVDGHRGTFVVVRVDKVNLRACVEPWDNPSIVLRDVPFHAIQLNHNTMIEAA
jgi:hypothetical protein